MNAPLRMVLLTSSLLLTGLASAEAPGPGRAMMGNDMGCGWMGSGMMRSHMGYGMGPGMMEDGMGPGMMGPGMMGPGMMGPGMMGPGMMSRGMGFGRMMGVPDLTDQQRQSLVQRHRQLEKQMLDLEKQGLDARFALEDALAKDTPDPKAVGNAMQGVFNVRKQMAEAAIAAHNDMLGTLTDEQRQALESHRWMGPGARAGAMGHHRMMQQPPGNSQ